jgi:hypothetical protein
VAHRNSNSSALAINKFQRKIKMQRKINGSMKGPLLKTKLREG